MRIQLIPALLHTTEPVLIIEFSYKMFEPNMDDYLDDEMEELKRAFEVICKDWEQSVSLTATSMVCIHIYPQTRDRPSLTLLLVSCDRSRPMVMPRPRPYKLRRASSARRIPR